jgi:hypothetical protein
MEKFVAARRFAANGPMSRRDDSVRRRISRGFSISPFLRGFAVQ